MNFSPEQLRVLENLAVAYDEWRQSTCAVIGGRPWLAWKTVSSKEYLYERRDRLGQGRSLGRRSPETEALFQQYQERMAKRQDQLARSKSLLDRLGEIARLYRALRLPMLDAIPGAILREADVRGMLGQAFLVVGTTAMLAYELEAQHRFATDLDATEDFDLSWCAEKRVALTLTDSSASPILDLLKSVDETFTENLERPFQARNRMAYEVEVLCAPSVHEHYPASERLRPVPMPEQEWLLQGRPVSQVVVDRANVAARIVAPDPRWMALHKMWLSNKPGRNRRKVEKDRRQGEALRDAIISSMPHYLFDEAFESVVPAELKPYLPP
jgi:hypothetical protein